MYNDSRSFFHFKRPRLNQLFLEAVRCPLVVVCAGAGYGKTSAIHDFLEEYQPTVSWIQLSERDNVVPRFWEKITHNWARHDPSLARAMVELGFPDTREKLNRYLEMVRDHVEVKSRVVVIDDFHCIEEPQVIRFLEESVFFYMPPGTSIFIVSRTPLRRVNIASLTAREQMFNISENDLRFTENELAQYFRRLDISARADNLREIMQDTEGWTFAINLIARSYQKAPGYGGYVRNAMKTNIFRLMETEIWDEISECLQNFLIRLSLIDHLSIDLIAHLAGKEKGLIAELEKQNAYVRRDNYINAYLIHPLFLEFLSTKQEYVTEEQKRETYAVAGDWCNQNGFKIDAMSYYEKMENYPSIVSILNELPAQIPHNIAQYASAIFDRAPAQAFDTVKFFAVIHLRTYMCQGFLQKSVELAEYYEKKFLKLPESDGYRNRVLANLYFCLAILRGFMCITDDRYDMDVYVEKLCKCLSLPIIPGKNGFYYPSPWFNLAGSSRKGAPEEYIGALDRVRKHISHYPDMESWHEDDLARGELKFYRGNIRSAEIHISGAIKQLRLIRQFGLIHRALFYILRIAVSQGNYLKAERVLKDMKPFQGENEYPNRFIDYDISLSWYYYILGLPEKIPDWLKENFSPYSHAGFVENYANQMKARYCYATRNFSPLLSYIEEMKMRESFLFGRVEMLAIESCVHYLMKNKKKAFAAFEEAYITASPNEITMPFIELGKDMRTLTSAALKYSDGKIPKPWLEDINRKSASYAKRRTHIAAKYKKANGLTDNIVFSPREAEVFADLVHGLSRAEIAANRGLSVNTIKMVIANIYSRLGAENLADLIRIAAERKLI
jgi:LuxR family maltose regulon positive regulatory protein